MKQAYITALADALLSKTETDSVLKNAQLVLTKKGHSRLWPAVLRGTVRELEKRNRLNSPQVIVSDGSKPKTEELIKALKAVGAEASASYQTAVDETIIGGFIVRYRDLMIDASYKRALTDLYRKITKS